jgi:hypothetical protein
VSNTAEQSVPCWEIQFNGFGERDAVSHRTFPNLVADIVVFRAKSHSTSSELSIVPGPAPQGLDLWNIGRVDLEWQHVDPFVLSLEERIAWEMELEVASSSQ